MIKTAARRPTRRARRGQEPLSRLCLYLPDSHAHAVEPLCLHTLGDLCPPLTRGNSLQCILVSLFTLSASLPCACNRQNRCPLSRALPVRTRGVRPPSCYTHDRAPGRRCQASSTRAGRPLQCCGLPLHCTTRSLPGLRTPAHAYATNDIGVNVGHTRRRNSYNQLGLPDVRATVGKPVYNNLRL